MTTNETQEQYKFNTVCVPSTPSGWNMLSTANKTVKQIMSKKFEQNSKKIKFPKEMSANIIPQKNLKNSRQRRKCGNVVTTRIEHVRVNRNNTVTNALRKSQKIFSLKTFQNGGQVNFGKNIWKPKKNFFTKTAYKSREVRFGGINRIQNRY